jgi:hypothetical protein
MGSKIKCGCGTIKNTKFLFESAKIYGWPSYAAGKQADVSAIRFGPHIFVSMLLQIMERETGFEPATLSLEG